MATSSGNGDKLSSEENIACEAVKKEIIGSEHVVKIENIENDEVKMENIENDEVKIENIDNEEVKIENIENDEVKIENIENEDVVTGENVTATSATQMRGDAASTQQAVKAKRVLPAWMVSSSTNGSSHTPAKRRKQAEKEKGASTAKTVVRSTEDDEVWTTASISGEPSETGNTGAGVIEISDEEEEEAGSKKEKDGYESSYGDLGPSDGAGASGAGAGASSTTRPPCMYGSGCYRRNLQHRSDYCHPGDADYTSSPTGQAECQYGTSCYRQNPQHRLDFAHTQAYTPPPPTTPRTSNVFHHCTVLYVQCPDCKRKAPKDPYDSD